MHWQGISRELRGRPLPPRSRDTRPQVVPLGEAGISRGFVCVYGPKGAVGRGGWALGMAGGAGAVEEEGTFVLNRMAETGRIG